MGTSFTSNRKEPIVTNDRFLFRAWNKNSERFRKDIVLEINQGEFLQCGGGSLDDSDLIFMQCTGLKDRNDQLIYPDDILKILHTGWPEDWIGVVTLVNERYTHFQYVIRKANGNITYNTWRKEDIEVIGNIYEDSHLLEEK